MSELIRDGNRITVAGGQSSTSSTTVLPFLIDSVTGRVLTDSAAGAGTVTSVSVVSANGFAGTVATATTTPAITLTTTITGVLKGNGTAISAASAGTDYVAPGAITTSGLTMATDRILGRTTAATGAVEEITIGSGLSLAAGTLSATGGSDNITVGTTTITSGTTTRILYNNAGILGEYTLTGSGTVVAMQTAPTFATSITTPSVLATANDSGALGASGTAFSDLFLASGGVINWSSGDITITHATNDLTFGGSAGAANGFFFSNDVSPTANDGAALGKSTTSWSDLFLASGGVINFNNGNATLTHSTGLITSNVSLSLGTSNVLTTGTIELGAASDTTLSRSAAGVLAVEGVVIPSISSTNTLTNKRITRRLTTTNAPGATPTTNTDNVDIMNFTGLNAAITSMTTNLSGTPVDGDLIEFRFTDDGTARGITWGASFAATTVALPTTTVISTMLRVLFEWNGSIWQCIATA